MPKANAPPLIDCFFKVARAGLEPARHYWQGILSPQRLPIPPPSHYFYRQRIAEKSLLRGVLQVSLHWILALHGISNYLLFRIPQRWVGPSLPHLRVEITPKF